MLSFEGLFRFAGDVQHACMRLQEIISESGRVPQYFREWLNWSTTWQTFDFNFLREWGARWAPALERGGDSGDGAWWLWVTPIYLHQSLTHIISNLLLFVAMSVHLELNYGWWRLLLVWMISGAWTTLCCSFAFVVSDVHLFVLSWSCSNHCQSQAI